MRMRNQRGETRIWPATWKWGILKMCRYDSPLLREALGATICNLKTYYALSANGLVNNHRFWQDMCFYRLRNETRPQGGGSGSSSAPLLPRMWWGGALL